MKHLIFNLTLLALISTIGSSGCTKKSSPWKKLEGKTMGTYWRATVFSNIKTDKELIDAIQKKLDHINELMSTYKDDSELSRINSLKKTGEFMLHVDTFKVISEALRIATLTGGAFDPTIGPVVNMWGFGPESKPEKIPSSKMLLKKLKTVGYDKVTVNSIGPALIKMNPNIYLDLSAIAKGYAVDLVGKTLKENGSNDFMVEVGGEIVVSGKNPEGKSWKIGIENPQVGGGSLKRIIYLHNEALATSGSYRNYYEKNGTRYSHMIDPRTGHPITHRLVSVSVVEKNCMTADALATALMVMGSKEGLNFSEKYDLATLFIVKDGKGFREIPSSSFQKAFGEGKSQL